MKYLLSFSLLLALLCGILPAASAQEAMLSPRITAKTDNVEISYGQPSKRGRVIFGDLVPYSEVWRTGANEATEITFKKDGMFGGKPVKAGTYAMYTIPGQNQWTIILNSELGQWGAYTYEQNKAKNVLEVTVPAKQGGDMMEKFTITLKKDMLVMAWDKTTVSVPMKF